MVYKLFGLITDSECFWCFFQICFLCFAVLLTFGFNSFLAVRFCSVLCLIVYWFYGIVGFDCYILIGVILLRCVIIVLNF